MVHKIWEQFHDELYRFIAKRVSDEDLANDILQEVFIKIMAKHNTLSNKDKLSAWIYQITRNTIIDYYRKHKARHSIPDLAEEHTHDTNLNRDLLCCLLPFIQKLTPKYRHVLQETVFGDLSQKEYALQNNLSYTAVKSRVQRARKQLKDAFTQCCYIESDKYGSIISIESKNCDCDE